MMMMGGRKRMSCLVEGIDSCSEGEDVVRVGDEG